MKRSGPGYHLALWLLLLSAPSQAHLPALYGWEFLRADHSVEAGSTDCQADVARTEEGDHSSRHQKRIEALEIQQGPYGEGLAEPLADLGRYHRDRGEFDEALGAYRRALHLVRINSGLHSQQQLAVLDELAKTHRLQGDWKALDEVQSQKFALLGGGRPPYGGRGFDPSLDYLEWQREAHGLQFDGNKRERLLLAFLLNQRLLDSLEKEAATQEDQHKRLIYSQLSNLYLIMGDRYLEAGSESVGSSTELHASQSGSPSYVRRRLAEIQAEGVQTGAALFSELFAIAGPENAVATAAAHLELGDWYQWNGDTRSARAEYSSVERILKQVDEPVLLRQWLGAPQELPYNQQFQQYGSAETGIEAGSVTVRFHVSARGLADGIEVVEGAEEDSGIGDRVKRMLVETHFRPRVVDGEPRVAGTVQREYRFITRPGESPGECIENNT